MAASIYIGTSGYSYKNWAGDFYPEDIKKDKWLQFYSSKFDTVEINNTFYNLPQKKTFRNWAKKTPENFLFSIKASRYITHMKKLKDCKQPLDNLLEVSSGLGKKLGPILFQLPKNLKKNAEKLKNFAGLLPNDILCAFEFREKSWFDNEIYSILEASGYAIVISSSPSFPYHEKITGEFCYIRLHGSEKLYSSSYTDKQLKKFANIAKKCKEKGLDSYIYFNNDAKGHAFRNALTLKELL
ncbi:MAG: DUF72 domain-containing protein [Actinomycetota bacterium]